MRKIYINGESIGDLIFKNKFNYKEIMDLDKAIGHLKRNKEKYMQVVVVLAYILLFNPTLSFAADDKVIALGYKLIKKVQLYAGIVAMVMAAVEVAAELVKGGRGYFQIVIKYGVGYIALMLIPVIFETIRNLF